MPDHSTIYDRSRGCDFGADCTILAVSASHLRRKLATADGPDTIRTVCGVG